MIAVAAALVLLQEKDPLAGSWTKLQEAWHAAAEAKGEGDFVDDKLLRASALLHGAFEASGLNAKELAADRVALKRALKARLVPAVKATMPKAKDVPSARDDIEQMRQMLEEAILQMEDGTPAGLRKRVKPEVLLQQIKSSAKAADDAPAERAKHADAVAESLVQLQVLPKDAAPWVRRRVSALVIALELKKDYPAQAVASPEVRQRVKRLIEELGDDDIAVREKANASLVELGEAAVPQLKEAAGSDNPEIRLRARALLGLKE